MKDAFPEAFTSVINKGGSVADAGAWFNGEWSWKTLYNTKITKTHTVIQVDEINRILTEIQPLQDEEDDYIRLARQTGRLQY